ncbi:hypothetical protein [Paracoccus sp. SY]|uniref:hypothetical protein n=1 Tax=Paracoccus sp. SY TaxID=1330255 RepID=UPI000CD149B9|nr:hypothetical protein [Paracoccus sp. SY]
MADRPILFSGPMVRAILDGRKTQTRRVLKPVRGLTLGDLQDEGEREGNTIHCARHQVQEPSFAPGDRLWVRETFSYECLDVDRDGILPPWYWADGNPSSGDFTRPKPSIHMPRWASRLTLIVTDVRVQRLQDISEADAVAEGIYEWEPRDADGMRHFGLPELGVSCPTAARGFMWLWDSLNEARGFGWNANPWVVAVTFSAHQRNIDQMEAA